MANLPLRSFKATGALRALAPLLGDLSLHKDQRDRAAKPRAQWQSRGNWVKITSLTELPLDHRQLRLELALLVRHLYQLTFDGTVPLDTEDDGDDEDDTLSVASSSPLDDDDDDDDDVDDDDDKPKVDPAKIATTVWFRHKVMVVRDALDGAQWILPEVSVSGPRWSPKKTKKKSKKPKPKKKKEVCVCVCVRMYSLSHWFPFQHSAFSQGLLNRRVNWYRWEKISLLPQPNRLSATVRLERFCWTNVFGTEVCVLS